MANIIIRKDGSSWNYALGCRERDAKDHIKRMRDRGIEIAPVESDSAPRNNPKSNWDWTRKECQGLGRELEQAGVGS